MKRLFSLILALVLAAGGFCTAAEAYTIEGSVSYTVERARKEAFANVEYTIPQEIIDSNLVDPNFKANKKAMKNGVRELPDRLFEFYSDGGYTVVYKKNLYYEYEYQPEGRLKLIGKRSGLITPLKSYQYNTQNELVEITLYVTTQEVYIFTANGQLTAHWKGNKCYDLNGNLIKTSY